MSFSDLSGVSNKDLGETLLLYQIKDFLSIVNSDTENFRAIAKYMDSEGVTANGIFYSLQTSREVSNAQHVAVGATNRVLTKGKSHTLQQYTVNSKQLEVAATFDDDVLARAKEAPESTVVDPVKMEMHNQNINSEEMIAKSWWGDGTGVQATVASLTSGTPTNKATIVVYNQVAKRGTIRWIQKGQELHFVAANGTKLDFECAATPAYYKVDSINLAANSFIITPYTSADVATTITGNSGSNPVAAEARVHNAGDYAQQGSSYQDLSGTDINYDGGLYPVGLATHSANDGRKIGTLTLDSTIGGTRYTASGSPSPDMILDLMRMLEDANGRGEFVYPSLDCSTKLYTYLLQADENAVVLQPQQRARGGKVITVAWGEGDTEFNRTRFCPDYIMYAAPMNGPRRGAFGEQQAPLQFKFSGFDFMTNPGNNDIFFPKFISGEQVAAWVARMRSFYAFVCPHHPSLGSIAGFTVPT